MSRHTFSRHFRFWIFPLILIFGGAIGFSAWCEDQLEVPGGLRDVEFWEKAMSSTDLVGDLIPLSGYLHHRVAESLVFPQRSSEGLLVFSFMDSVIQGGDPSRRLTDLKYDLAVYKKQILLYAPASLRFYDEMKKNFESQKKVIPEKTALLSDSEARMKTLRALNLAEKQGDVAAVTTQYQEALKSPEFASFQPHLMLKLAYFLYESQPKEALQWLEKLEQKNPDEIIRHAAEALKKKLYQRKNKAKTKSSNSLETQIDHLFSVGLLNEAFQMMRKSENETLSTSLYEIQAWLGAAGEETLKNKRTFFSSYFNALQKVPTKPLAAAEQLADLALDKNLIGYSAILRYRAWSLAYFDAKNYSQASFFSQLLKVKDPLSAYSQLESMQGLFQNASKVYTSSQLLDLWKREPYRFEMIQKKDDWIGFKNARNRISETIVHEGQVYVLNYNAEGKAISLQRTLAGERVFKKREMALKQAEKTGWMDQAFYDYMIRYLPLGVRTFKNQIGKLAQFLPDPVFTRLYTEDNFQTYVLDKMRPALGSTVKNIQVQIDEQGFHVYATLNIKGLNVSSSGLGKVLTEGGDGRLNLKIDHVKVGALYLPEWLLRRVEKNFDLTVNTDAISRSSGIDILEMKYRSGGILMKCERRSA